MAADATLRGEGFRLLLRIHGYESPHHDTGWDANWLVCDIELDITIIGSLQARLRATVLTKDLVDFQDELCAVHRDLGGEATLENMENEFKVTVRLDAGKGNLAGFVRVPRTPMLQFTDIETDQTFIHEALGEFQALAAAFPVRGQIPRASPPTTAEGGEFS